MKISESTQLRLLTAARFLIGCLFIYSGLSKVIQPIEYFEVALGMYRIVPDNFLHLIALIVPWIELTFGTYLFLGYALQESAGALTVLTVIFQLVLAQAVIRRLPIDECGCFGGGYIHLTLYQSFAVDTILALILIAVATSDKSLFSLDNRIR